MNVCDQKLDFTTQNLNDNSLHLRILVFGNKPNFSYVNE